MAVETAVFEVGETEVLLTTGISAVTMFIKNMGMVPVYLGATGVTSDNGWPLFPGDEIQSHYIWSALSNESIYAIAGRGPVCKVYIAEGTS